MSTSAILLVVLAAFIHAFWNLLAKRAAYLGPIFVFAYTAASAVIYLPWLGYLLWQGRAPWNWPVVACLVASGILHLAYSLCLQHGYRVADLSIVYPVARGSAPLLSASLAVLIFLEKATPLTICGIALIIIGIGLTSIRNGNQSAASGSIGAGIRWGMATGILIAGYTVVDAFGVKSLGIFPVLMDWFANALRVGMLAPYAVSNRSKFSSMKGSWMAAVAVGALSPLSYILVLSALSAGAPVSLVAPARELSMMVAALLGMVMLREAVSKTRLLGCAVLTVGVMMLGAS